MPGLQQARHRESGNVSFGNRFPFKTVLIGRIAVAGDCESQGSLAALLATLCAPRRSPKARSEADCRGSNCKSNCWSEGAITASLAGHGTQRAVAVRRPTSV